MRKVLAGACALGVLLWAAAASAQETEPVGPAGSGRLLLTSGVKTIEGSGGGGLSTWATITGYGTDRQIGGNVHGTLVELPDYQFRTYGAAVGLFNRLELSYARQEFDTEETGGKLGLGNGFTFGQDVYGAKLRVFGDAVYDQDKWYPQVSVGIQHKENDQGGVVALLGAADDSGTDYYVAATKILLNSSLVLNGTVRFTKANQTGLLGFGAVGDDDYEAQFEGSAGVLLTKRLVVGAEYRTKPNNLGLKEDDWVDLFAAYAINKNLSITAAYVDLGEIATFKDQRGLYVSLAAGF